MASSAPPFAVISCHSVLSSERLFLVFLLLYPILIFSIAFYHHQIFSLKISFRKIVCPGSVLFDASFLGPKKFLAHKM
jgi:hypothetical protein